MSHSCNGKLYNKESCARETIKDTDWCIFHHPNKTGELIKKFDKALLDEIKKQKDEHKEYIDFTGFDFPSNITFKENFPSLYCGNATFREPVNFTGLISETRSRLPESYVDKLEINGEAWFYGTKFLKQANFQRTIFNGAAVFSFAEFGGTAFFNNAKFNNIAIFTKASFFDSGWFIDAEFNKRTRFSNIKVSDTLSLSDILIKNRFYIDIEEWLPFKDDYSFSIYTVNVKEIETKDDGKIIISGSMGIYTEEIVAGISILDNDLKKVEFIDEKWLKADNKRKIIIDEMLLDRKNDIQKKMKNARSPTNKKKPIIGLSSPTISKVAQTYRNLRDNFENNNRYAEAGDFFVGEMEIFRKHDPSLLNRCLYTVYNIFSSYGESVLRPIILLLMTIIFVTFLKLDFSMISSKIVLSDLISKSFTSTIKNIFPFHTISKVSEIPTRFIGTLLIALTFIAIRRRLERR